MKKTKVISLMGILLLLIFALQGCEKECESSNSAPTDHTYSAEGCLHKPDPFYPTNSGCGSCHGSSPNFSGGAGRSCYACHGHKWIN
ncbi:MAG: hypothetical protein OEV44_00515 [Spirochaetota bacterium]|nr:hypothetical protein [Spirochaetota bacterium]